MGLKIHKSKVLETMKACPEFERIAKMLWPEELEEKPEFEVGDIVEGTENHDSIYVADKMGIVKNMDLLPPWLPGIGVEFFEDIKGHDLAGCAQSGHGFYMPANKLRLIYRPRK